MTKRTYTSYTSEHILWLHENITELGWAKLTIGFNKEFNLEVSEPTLRVTYANATKSGKLKKAQKSRKDAAKMGDKENVKFLVIPDMHVPYHDQQAVDAMLACAQDFKPDIVVQIGDLMDFTSISVFNKDPRTTETLAYELEMGKDILAQISKALPDADKHYIQGNHEDRWQRHLIKNSGEFLELFGDTGFTEYMNLQAIGFTFHEYDYVYRGFQFVHGDYVRKFAGYTAKAMHEKSRSQGAMGHTHRQGVFSHTYRDGIPMTFMETGHLFSMQSVEYIKGFPNWQKGFAMGDMWWPTPGELHVNPYLIKVAAGACVYNGKKYVG